MLVDANARRPASAHVVVLGNEKGGSGKSTTAMHVAVALMNVGQRVATIDLDSRQKSFTHYIENRRAWAKRARIDLKVPVHFCVARGSTLKLDENETIEFSGFAEAVTAVEQSHDFVVVDTPGTDSYLTRLAHSHGRYADHAAQRQLRRLRRARHRRRDDLRGHRRKSLCRDGARRSPAAAADRRHADGLDRGAQPAVDAGLAQQTLGRRGAGRSGDPARLSQYRRARRACGLSRVLPARADRARSTRRGDARHPLRACRT